MSRQRCVSRSGLVHERIADFVTFEQPPCFHKMGKGMDEETVDGIARGILVSLLRIPIDPDQTFEVIKPIGHVENEIASSVGVGDAIGKSLIVVVDGSK